MKPYNIKSGSAVILTILTSLGCSQPGMISAPLPMPAEAIVPTINDRQLSCLPDAVYQTLVKRDQAYQHSIQRLKAVIESTWE